MNTHLVIPARFASTRLPGKPLADINGKPMLVRVLERAGAVACDSVTAAVDDQRVADAVHAAGFSAVMTSSDHESGSDRVMEVAAKLGWADTDIVVNVQGDEPLFPVQVVDDFLSWMRNLPAIEIATLSEPLALAEEFQDPNIVKVVTSSSQKALYFSRATIPFFRDGPVIMDQVARHVGIYAFKVAALRKCTNLPVSSLEKTERLEQLRWLQDDQTIHVYPSAEPIPGGVDTPADLERVRRLLAE